MGITIEFDIITSKEAREIVAREGLEDIKFHHRPTKAMIQYGSDMLGLRWQINGDAIIFDSNGRLIDGRKRLLAAARNNASFPTMIVLGVDPAAAEFIDQHKRRSAKDVIHAAGFDDAANFASTIAAVTDIALRGLPSQSIISHGSLLRLARDRPEIQEFREKAAASPLRKYYSPSDFAALSYLTSIVDPDESKAFFDGLEDAVRNRIINSKVPLQSLAASLLSLNAAFEAGGARGSTRSRYAQVIYTIKTWNAMRAGTRFIHLRHDFNNNETPPRINGLPDDLFNAYLPGNEPAVEGDLADAYLQRLETDFPEAAVEIITPEIASEIMEANGPLHDGMARNRQISRADVAAYSRDIVNRRWMVTGQSIKISASGRLLDGQHRLQAVIDSKMPIEIVVVRNLPDDIFSTFDVAHQHTLSNILTSRGEPSAARMQSALKVIWHYRETGLANPKGYKPTLSEVLELYEACPDLRHHIRASSSTGFKTLNIAHAATAALMYIFHEINPEKATEFFYGLETGAQIDTDTPIWALRDSLMRLNNWSNRNKRITLTTVSRTKLICHAWVPFLAGRKRIRLAKEIKAINALDMPAPFDRPAAPTLGLNRPPEAESPIISVQAIDPAPTPTQGTSRPLRDLDDDWLIPPEK